MNSLHKAIAELQQFARLYGFQPTVDFEKDRPPRVPYNEITPEMEQEIISMYQDGARIQDIINTVNVHSLPIYRILKKHGISGRTGFKH